MRLPRGLTQLLQNSVNRRLSSNSEVLVKVLGRASFTKTMHPDKDAILPDPAVPAPAHRGLDRHFDGRVADDGLLLVLWLGKQQFERGHRDHPRRDSAPPKFLL